MQIINIIQKRIWLQGDVQTEQVWQPNLFEHTNSP